MPELPEVEIFKRLVEKHCLGREIGQASVLDPGMLDDVSPATLARRLNGATLESSRRHGKYLFAGLERDGALILHFGTNGSLQFLGREEPDPSYTRLRLDFVDGHRLAYVNLRRLGGISFAESAETFIAAGGLGPDALDRAFDLPAFAQALTGRRRDIKSVLMDQALMAGIGNIYSDEILFQAAIHPGTSADALDSAATKRLFRAMKSVLETAVERGAGSERGMDRVPRNFLQSQRRHGGRCPQCGGEIATRKFAGRTGYFCPRCQPEPG